MRINELDEFYQGFAHFFPEGTHVNNKPFLKWKNLESFTEEVKRFTKIDISSGDLKLIKESQQILSSLAKRGEEIGSILPQKGTRDIQEQERRFRESAKKTADINAKKNVEASIKKLYAKVKTPEAPKVTPEDQKIYEELKEIAQGSPNKLVEEISDKTEISIPQEIKDSSSPQDVKKASLEIATRVVTDLRNGPEPLDVEKIILTKVNPSIKQEFLSETFGREIVETFLSKSVTSLILGIDPTIVDVEILSGPEGATHMVDVGNIETPTTLPKVNVGQVINFGIGPIGLSMPSFPKDNPIESAKVPTRFQNIVLIQQPKANFEQKNTYKGYSLNFAPNEVKISDSLNKPGITLIKDVEQKVKTSTQSLSSKTTIATSRIKLPDFNFSSITSSLKNIIPPKTAKEIIPWAVGVIVGVPVAAVAGIPTGIFTGVTATGITSIANGGTTIKAGISTAITGVVGAIGSLISYTLSAVAIPIIITLIAFPLTIALFMFIINSGAYVVPPGGNSISSTNAFISVEKTADPSGNVSSPTSITYKVTIGAKKDSLTGIAIDSECHATKKGGNLDCPNEEIPPAPASIAVGSPFTFTFTSKYDSKYQDSLVSDTITVNATTTSGEKVSEIGSASVCFGNCPLDCFAFPEKYWPNNPDVQKLKSLLTEAVGTLVGKYPNYAAKACTGPTINLCYNPSKLSSGIFGYHESSSTCDIDFNTRVVSYGSEGALFLLTHEVSHHLQNINPGLLRKFMDKVYPIEPSVCTYGGSSPEESMAEGSALYVARPIIDQNAACLKSYQSQYPKHYDFAKNVMFAP